jgi:hypothetical protein
MIVPGFFSQMLVLSAVYFISEECAIFLPMAAENTPCAIEGGHHHGSAAEG